MANLVEQFKDNEEAAKLYEAARSALETYWDACTDLEVALGVEVETESFGMSDSSFPDFLEALDADREEEES